MSEARGVRRRIIRLLGRDALVLCTGLVAIEVALQFLAPEYGRCLYDWEFTGSHPIELNENACRGQVVPKAKSDGEVRILALGDSITFGTGVAVEHTWPSRLGAMMGRSLDRPVSVVNTGMPGASVAEMQYAYDTVWSEYEPEFVALAVSGNMVALSYIRRNDDPRMPRNGFDVKVTDFSIRHIRALCNRAVHRLCLPSFLSQNSQRGMYWLGLVNHNIDASVPAGALLAYGFRQGDIDPGLADRAWRLLAEDLGALRDSVARHNARFAVTFTPCRFQVSGSTRDNMKAVPRERLTIDPTRRLREICRSLSVAYADSLCSIRSHRERIAGEEGRLARMYVPFDYNHLDTDGHGAVADALLRTLVSARCDNEGCLRN